MVQLKEYQKEAVEIVENKFNSEINRTCIIWPTGLGKTTVPIELMKKHPEKKFLIIAPKHNILNQTRQYMEEENISLENAMFYTYIGLSKMKEDIMKNLNPDYIVLDEMHRAGAKEWGKGIDRLLEIYPKEKLLGLTATPMRMDGRDMVEEKFDGDISHQITLEEAIARGLLKMPKSYINAVYTLDGEISNIEKSIKNIQDKEKRNELRQKLETVKRNLKKSKGLDEIFAERMSNKKGKYIVFCKDIEHMHEMMEKAESWFKEVNNEIETYSISSEKNPLQNSRELRHFKKNNNESLKLLYSVEMFNEGLHIENDGIIMLRPTSSWITYVQQLGRTLGIEKSGEVFDIVNNSRSSKDIYQFCEQIKEIQKREKIERVSVDFTIYDEIMNIQELLKEISSSIYREQISTEKKIEYLRVLKEQGVNLSKIKQRDKTEDGTPIGSWITQWRVVYKKGTLSEEEIKKITELGIDLKAQNLSTKEKIEILERLKEKGLDVTKIKQEDKTENGEPIGKWIHRWRVVYKKGTLSEEEIKKITELGIDLKAQNLSTKEKIEILERLKEKGLDVTKIKRTNKTEDGTSIGHWIKQWREAYNKGTLSEEEIKKITELGIDLKAQNLSTKEKIEILERLKEKGLDVTKIKQEDKTENGEPISKWIHRWREVYNKGKLSEEEIKKITNLGIDLNVREIFRNEEKIEILERLKEEGLDVTKIKQTDKAEDGTPIGKWVNQWRSAYKKSKLSEEEIEQITSLGIKLSLRDRQKEKNIVEEKLEETKKLCKQYEKLIEEDKKEESELHNEK